MVVASEPAIAGAIEKYYTSNVSFEDVMLDFADEEEEFELDDVEEDLNVLDLEKSAGDAPVVKLVNLILLDAIRKCFRYPCGALRKTIADSLPH